MRHLVLTLVLSASLSYGQGVPPGNPKLSLPGKIEVPPAPIRPKVLEATSSRVVSAPDFGGYGTPVCDNDGNAYYHVGTSASYNDSTVFRLAADEDRHQVFKLPPDVNDSVAFGAFNVTPSGKLWTAVFNQKGEVFAYGFDAEGEVSGHVHFNAPEYLQPDLFAAFETDFFLLEGFFAKSAGSAVAGRTYAAIFGPSGKLVRELTLNQPVVNMETRRKSLPEGAVAIGSDGNAYLLLADQVVAISQSGEVVQRLQFEKPDRDARAVSLYASGGLLAIVLFKTRHTAIDTTLLVLDTNTGGTYGYYEPSEGLGNNPICFSRSQGFTFLRRDRDGKIKLQTAALR